MPSELSVEQATISTRRRARQIAAEAEHTDAGALNLGSVEFVSRSVADELVHQSEKRSLELRGLDGDVATMIDAVRDDSAAPA